MVPQIFPQRLVCLHGGLAREMPGISNLHFLTVNPEIDGLQSRSLEDEHIVAR